MEQSPHAEKQVQPTNVEDLDQQDTLQRQREEAMRESLQRAQVEAVASFNRSLRRGK